MTTQSKLKTKSEITKAPRNVNFEVLRIVAMLLIILHHFSRHISYEVTFDSVCFNSVIVDLFGLGGNVGVAIFVLISGYFDSKTNYSSKKFVRLICEVAFYNVVFFIITTAMGANEFRLKSIPRVLFSFIFSGYEYWFINVFLLLMLFTPLLNLAVKKVNKNQFLFLLITLFLVWSVFPYTISKVVKTTDNYFSLLGWFILLYLAGAYLRKYPPVMQKKKFAPLFFFIGMQLIFIGSNVAYSILPEDSSLKSYITIFSDSSKGSAMSTLVAISFIVLFASFKPHTSKWVYFFSSATFGVYLCHNNEFFRKIMWYDIFHITDFSDSKYLFIYGIAITIVIFLVCVLIDQVRIKLLENPIFNLKFVNTIFEKADNLINKKDTDEKNSVCD